VGVGDHTRVAQNGRVGPRITRDYVIHETVVAHDHSLGVIHMAREKRIRLDSDEKAILRDVRRRHFGGDETPYGYVVAELARFYESEHRSSNVEW
jgi:hypothetical protein